MGEKLRYSDLYRVMDAAAGVDWVEIKTPTSTVAPDSPQALIVLGRVELTVTGDD